MSSPLKLSNNAIGKLAGNAGTSATSFSLQTGQGALFPALAAGEFFPITVVRASDGAHEIMRVTARAGDVLTVTRAQETTTALAFLAGDRVELRLTAQTLLDMETSTATHAAASKAAPVDADELPLVDSEALYVLKKFTWASLKAGIFSAWGALINGGTGKTAPVDADAIAIMDSAASNATKKLTLANLKAFLFSADLTVVAGKKLVFEGATDDANETTIDPGEPTGDRTLTLPDKNGTLATIDDTAQAGAIGFYAMNTPPTGWLKANGASLSRTSYATLFAALVKSGTVTISVASPGVITWNGHNRSANDPVKFTTTGVLPTGLTAGITYYVVGSSITTNTFQVSATAGGAAINTSGTQSGTHTAIHAPHGDGDGSTTFTIPDLRGEHIRGWDDGRGIDANRAFGSGQLDALQNITGSYDPGAGNNDARLISSTTQIGAFSLSKGTGGQVVNNVAFSSSSYVKAVNFDASLVARTSTETRGRNLSILACIKF